MELVLERTPTDLMGKLILCWATVVLWVRVALKEEMPIWCGRGLGVVKSVWIIDISGKTQRHGFPSPPHYYVWWNSILKDVFTIAYLYQESAR